VAATIPERATTVARYILLDRIGAGGMGVVYSAYDPDLDRKVAIKLLHAGVGDGDDARRLRLAREAQAMARLAHPNVVAVHDVGVHAGELFVAMALVEGRTLGAWLRAARRSPREVLRAFAAAGRGLAAAHDAGLVHRDFKPDNVLVRDQDGQILVGDFGLAGLIDVPPRGDGEPAGAQVTQAGARFGTPAYMAPEQHRGDRADARADQFAFCVALYEGLYAEHPFVGAAKLGGVDTLDALALDVIAGRVRAAPRATQVPAWLRRVVVRGLSPAPADRWPSMAALLAALERDPRRTLRRGLAVAGVAAAVAAGLLMWRREPAPTCAAAGARVATAWNDATRAASA
jgi:serine/threonine protein kinase